MGFPFLRYRAGYFMKRLLAIIILTCSFLPLFAAHIKGGEMYYRYIGPGSGTNSRYQISLKIYIDCEATNPGQLDASVSLTIFNKGTNQQFGPTVNAPLKSENFISFDPASNPCISNPPVDVCYRIRVYSAEVELPTSPNGWTIAYQRCCRIDQIVNLVSPSNASGATYMTEIPGTNVSPDAYKNSGPTFTANDAVAVCSASPFTISYAADEADGDSLVYRFCTGFNGASQANPSPPIASTPPYTPLSYQSPFNSNSPFGGSVTINSATGLVTGTAPAFITAPSARNQYVLTVCAYEYRLGILINIHRKDIHVKVSDCIPLKVQLKPDYSYCDDFNVTFKNELVNPPGSIYIWQFGDNTKSDTSTDILGVTQHQYTDTGSYPVKVKVILAGQCVDSTTTIARVYPGFYPGYLTNGSCKFVPFQFTDTTRSRYGTAARWKWNFGDESTLADTSSLKSPTWLYNTIGIKTVQLIVSSDKGCVDTMSTQVEVRDKPLIGFPFRDTLICSIDTLQLQAIGNGIFNWEPNSRIINPNSPDPFVFPTSTTYYRVTLNENGCISSDSVRVRVVDFVTLNTNPDTTICLNDPVRLLTSGDGLNFSWSPANTLDNPALKTPTAVPTGNTTYNVIASIGKCSTRGTITVRTVPYPTANAGADTTICYEDTATLQGSIIGSQFTWSPLSTLSTGNVLNPLAFPRTSTSYTLTVYDTIGCPKPMQDEVMINVREKILAFAGNDTNIVVGQPLQLSGGGAELFQWSPSFGLNQTNISNPVAILQENITYYMRAYTVEGCFADDTVNVRVFKTQPDIFVPNAFSPNGKNKVLRPIPVGISQIDYFRVYNRWGQLVFQTKEAGKGWDGTIGGKKQDTGSYAWMVQGRDFTGKIITKKGTAVLIR